MKKLVLINAILWALTILVSSFMFKEVPEYPYFLAVMVFFAGLMHTLLARKRRVEGGCR